MEDRIKKAIELKENGQWWNQILYDKAYELIEKPFPVIVPSYNRPDCAVMSVFKENNIDDTKYHAYFVVRESQKELYQESIGDSTNLHVMSFPDEEINSLGKTRKKIVDSFDDQIFMLDDDITNLYYLLPDKVVNTYKFRSEEGNFFRILAMWQILHEIAIKLNPNIITSNIHLRDFWWSNTPAIGYPETALKINQSVSFFQFWAFNCKLAHELNINFKHTAGHEDRDFEIRAVLAGCDFVSLNNITYRSKPLSVGFTGGQHDNLIDRMNYQADVMMEEFGQYKFVSDPVTSKGYRDIKIDFKKANKTVVTYDWLTELNNKYDDAFADIPTNKIKKSLW